MKIQSRAPEPFKSSSSSPPICELQQSSGKLPPPDNHLLTVKEVAEKLRLSLSGVHSLIRRGVLPHVNLACGKRRAPRIRISDLEAFIRSRISQGVKGERP